MTNDARRFFTVVEREAMLAREDRSLHASDDQKDDRRHDQTDHASPHPAPDVANPYSRVERKKRTAQFKRDLFIEASNLLP